MHVTGRSSDFILVTRLSLFISCPLPRSINQSSAEAGFRKPALSKTCIRPPDCSWFPSAQLTSMPIACCSALKKSGSPAPLSAVVVITPCSNHPSLSHRPCWSLLPTDSLWLCENINTLMSSRVERWSTLRQTRAVCSARRWLHD